MPNKERIIQKVIAEIDWYVIEQIRELRKNKFSQIALSIEIGFSEGFISRIENTNYSEVYNARHINLIAKAFKVKISDIMPESALKNDLIKLTIKMLPRSKPKKGEANYEVLRIIPLTNKEIRDYNLKTLNRLPKRKAKAVSNKRKSARSNK